MACRDVGKQSNHQRERLGEKTDEFNNGQQGTQGNRNTGHPKNVRPVILGAVHVGQDKGQYSQHQSDGNVSCYVGTSWEEGNQAQQVVDPNKEKQGEQIRGEPVYVLRGNVHPGNFVAHKQDQRLHKTGQP